MFGNGSDFLERCRLLLSRGSVEAEVDGVDGVDGVVQGKRPGL